MDPFTLDDATALRLLEEQALQRRLDARNRRVLPVVLWCFLLAFLAALLSSVEDFHGRGWPLGAAGVLITVAALVLLRVALPVGRAGAPGVRAPRAALVERFGQLLQGALVGNYLLYVAWTSMVGARPIPMFVMPWLLLLFRLVAGELVLLHTLVAVVGGVLWWIVVPGDALAGVGGAVPLNLVCGLLGLYWTRRFRAAFLVQWRQRVGRARDQERVREELALAREVQLSMLPACMPDLPWVDVCATTLPATEVGGDYYDFFPAEGELVVAVADVAGHGVAAGLVLASVRSGLALLVDDPRHELAVTLARLSGLVRRTSRRMLVTLAIARYARAERLLTVATAGHPPLLLRRRDGTIEEAVTPSPPLGSQLPVEARALRVPFGPGECCLLYTDGLLEGVDASGEAYGPARLQARLAAYDPARGASELVAEILADLARHRGAAPQEDDVTLVALVAR